MITRRGFLQSILAAGVAPFVCTTAGVLMPVRDLWKLSSTRRVAEVLITSRDLGFVIGDIVTIAELDTARQRYVVTAVANGIMTLRRPYEVHRALSD